MVAIIQPHDIVLIEPTSALSFDKAPPSWVPQAINQTRHFVVRRAQCEQHCIPIGIRGSERSQRYPATVDVSAIKAVYSPEIIVDKQLWKKKKEDPHWQLIGQCLDKLTLILKDRRWGVGGSIGYELLTQQIVTHQESDLDIIIKANTAIPLNSAKEIITLSQRLAKKVDIQVQNNLGAFHLAEYVQMPDQKILLKTAQGPCLTRDIWPE